MTTDSPNPKSRRGWLVWLAIAVVVLGAAGWLVWWLRPIQPVELKQAEWQALETKLEQVNQPPRYQRGAKEIVFTEREINGLLHRNTQLGDQLRLEFDRDAVSARLESDLSPDLPVVGGKRLKARARFLVRQEEGRPALVLDDVTVWGISLPNDWLGGLKGRDLLGEVLGGADGRIPGVERIEIDSGRLRILLQE